MKTLIAAAAALAVHDMQDVTVTWYSDGFCYVAHLDNVLTQADQFSDYTITDPIEGRITVNRAYPQGPETIIITAPGYTVDPPQVVLPDYEEAQMLICPEVGV